MKSATIPTVVAGLALAGVLLLFFRQFDAEPAPSRQEASGKDDSSLQLARLERRITELEQELDLLRADRPERETRPTRLAEPDPTASPLPEREAPRERDPAAPRASRPAAAIERLATDGKISRLTAAQVTQVEEKYGAVRRKLAAAMDEVRNNPANEGLEREARAELLRTELDTIRLEFETDLAGFLPPQDARQIAQELMTIRGGGNGQGRGRRGRGMQRSGGGR